MRKRFERWVRDQRGITGLETAIILIAFVVVASVFSFTVLSTGIFSSERAKETIIAGLGEAQSSMEPRGSVLAVKGSVDTDSDEVGDTDAVTKVTFVLSNSVAGHAVDLTPPYTVDDSGDDPDVNTGAESVVVISYTDEDQYINEVPWTVDFIGKDSGDFLLEKGEKAELTVWLQLYDGGAASPHYNDGTATDSYLATQLGINTQFTLEVKPPDGAVVTVQRITPPRLDTVMDLN